MELVEGFIRRRVAVVGRGVCFVVVEVARDVLKGRDQGVGLIRLHRCQTPCWLRPSGAEWPMEQSGCQSGLAEGDGCAR
jgi:hypothetical protein